jgi:hypothetical protein
MLFMLPMTPGDHGGVVAGSLPIAARRVRLFTALWLLVVYARSPNGCGAAAPRLPPTGLEFSSRAALSSTQSGIAGLVWLYDRQARSTAPEFRQHDLSLREWHRVALWVGWFDSMAVGAARRIRARVLTPQSLAACGSADMDGARMVEQGKPSVLGMRRGRRSERSRRRRAHCRYGGTSWRDRGGNSSRPALRWKQRRFLTILDVFAFRRVGATESSMSLSTAKLYSRNRLRSTFHFTSTTTASWPAISTVSPDR